MEKIFWFHLSVTKISFEISRSVYLQLSLQLLVQSGRYSFYDSSYRYPCLSRFFDFFRNKTFENDNNNKLYIYIYYKITSSTVRDLRDVAKMFGDTQKQPASASFSRIPTAPTQSWAQMASGKNKAPENSHFVRYLNYNNPLSFFYFFFFRYFDNIIFSNIFASIFLFNSPSVCKRVELYF